MTDTKSDVAALASIEVRKRPNSRIGLIRPFTLHFEQITRAGALFAHFTNVTTPSLIKPVPLGQITPCRSPVQEPRPTKASFISPAAERAQ